MFYTKEMLANSSRLRGHWDHLWSLRSGSRTAHATYVNENAQALTQQGLDVNSMKDAFGYDFWKEIDTQATETRRRTIGMEILEDLLPIQTVLNIGKTVKVSPYTNPEIAKDVSISMDGQAPYSFDHTEYGGDGDPVPVFTGGYGVNWRLMQGLKTINVDIVLDSQQAKLRVFYERLVQYMLNGDASIVVERYPAQGLLNHRNTQKMSLGDLKVDLTTADLTALVDFFSGPLQNLMIENMITKFDVMWVSPQIFANLSKPSVMKLVDNNQGVLAGSLLDQVRKQYPAIGEIRQTFALKGNQFIAYVRDRSVLTPLVGMPVSIWALPRFMPQHNYNFQIMAAMGLQVKGDADGHSGVLVGA